MSECNAIIEANNEIDRLKRENKKLNALCVQYGFDMGRLDEENEQLKEENQELRYFKLSIKAFAECNGNINRRTLNDFIGGIDYD